MAIRAFLLGLRLRRGRGVAAVRPHIRQHGRTRPQLSSRIFAQADPANIGSALLGGVVFNAANILLVAAIALSGMAVAFPVGIGLALVLGVLINYIFDLDPANRADPLLLFAGVALVMAAIILNARAYRKLTGPGATGSTKGLVLAVLCGILMSLFYSSSLGRSAKFKSPASKNLPTSLRRICKCMVLRFKPVK